MHTFVSLPEAEKASTAASSVIQTTKQDEWQQSRLEKNHDLKKIYFFYKLI